MKKIMPSLIILLLLSGCYSYKDIDNVEFVTDFIIDVAETNKIIVYTRAYKGIRSTNVTEESSKILMFKEEGETLFQAIRNMSLYSSSKLNYSHLKAVILTERAAKKGLDLFINFLERDQELNLRARVLIYQGDPNDLVNLDIRQEQILGLYLWEILKNSQAISKTADVSLNNILDASYSKSKTYVIPMINIINTVGTPQLTLANTALMNKWNMIGEISKNDMVYYNFLNNKIESSILTVPNPNDMNYNIAFEILKNKTKTTSKFIEDTFYVTKKINITTTLGEAQKQIVFSDDILNSLSKELSQDITNKCTEVFNKYKKQNIDILNVQNLCYKKYPKINTENILSQTVLQVEVKVTIKGSSNITDF